MKSLWGLFIENKSIMCKDGKGGKRRE